MTSMEMDMDMDMIRDRRRVCQTMAASLFLPALGVARAQVDSSTLPIRLVVPYPPGGFTDILARLLAGPLGAKLGCNIVVENRGGGAGTIGTGYVVRSPADGHTLVIVANDLAINETLMAGHIPYDARKDVAPVSQVAWSPLVLVVNPSFPSRSVGELIALAKARPGSISFGSGGNSTGGHLTLAMLNSRARIDITHIPYRGNGPAIRDLLGGQFAGMFVQYAVAKPYIAAGTLRVLATPSAQRMEALPDVPTIAESGFAGFSVMPWFGVAAPAGTPASVLARISKEIAQVVHTPEVLTRLSELGAEAHTSSPAEFAQLIDREIRDWGALIRKAGIKLE
jgi:tripartite-type tricarboxylate transporter receptor subunit TctC